MADKKPMMHTGGTMRYVLFVGVVVLTSVLSIALALADAVPKKDTQLPKLHLDAPPEKEDCSYLGIEGRGPFQLAHIKCDLIMLEVIGVYCPLCHQQRPHMNRLYHRVQKDAVLSKKLKFVGIAAGATPMEVAYLIKQTRVPYPVITDEKFSIHKQLGEPRTPFNMVVSKQGKVLWTHLGIIKDMDSMFMMLKKMVAN